jgi:hypothetical protein
MGRRKRRSKAEIIRVEFKIPLSLFLSLSLSLSLSGFCSQILFDAGPGLVASEGRLDLGRGLAHTRVVEVDV